LPPVKGFLIYIFDLFHRGQDLLAGFGVDELRKEHINVAFQNENNRISEFLVCVDDCFSFVDILKIKTV